MTKTQIDRTLRVHRAALASLRGHARRAAPEECCGALLIGEDGVVARAIPVENEAAQPSRRYLIGPETVSRLDRLAGKQGLRVAGYYHSHPDRPGEPSAQDLDAALPRTIYVIVGSDGIRAWQLRDDRTGFDEIRVERPGEVAC